MPHLLALTFPQPVATPELALPIALLLLVVGSGLLAHGRKTAQNAATLFTAVFALTLLALAAVWRAGPFELVIASVGVLKVSLCFDMLSTLMLALVSFLGVVVTRYSVNYLEGDPGQARFARWLCATLLSVFILILSGNLLLFAAAWMSTSLCLHQLLIFYPDRPGAKLAANKKFIISRMGDVCLLAALVLVWRVFGSFEFSTIFTKAATMHAGELSWICGLLATAALIKSAQFPFHSWLPDTMETPTPVSALMHAGIINAGGYLVLRLSPLLVQSPGTLDALALVGAFTALFASVIMMTQTSIKRSLAWSTIAQMGFMMLQCGLGAFALAMLHIVAHSLYKAHAFLSSGNIVNIAKSAWTPMSRPAAHPLVVLGSLIAAVAIGCGVGAAFGMTVQSEPGQFVLVGIFMMALAHQLWTLWSSSMRQKLLLWGLLTAGATAAVYFTLHAGFTQLLAESLPHYERLRSSMEDAVMVCVGLLFLAVLVLQSQLPLWAGRPAFARFYVHASNGFYLGTLINRITQKIFA